MSEVGVVVKYLPYRFGTPQMPCTARIWFAKLCIVVQQSIKFEVKLGENIEKAQVENAPTYKTLSTMRFYTVTFKKGLLPCHKKIKHQPFSWTNDEELDKLLLLNRKINAGETIESMKKELEEKELELKEKNAAAEEALVKYQRLV